MNAMHEQAEPKPDTAANAKPTKRDVQRQALRELVALSAECATRETEIEQRYQTESEQAAAVVRSVAAEVGVT